MTKWCLTTCLYKMIYSIVKVYEEKKIYLKFLPIFSLNQRNALCSKTRSNAKETNTAVILVWSHYI